MVASREMPVSQDEVFAVDALGQRHARMPGPARIVSLVPSLTELLCELGLRDQLVGRTGFCVHPRQALRDVPKLGGTKDVDLERLRALAPTHVVLNVDENEKPLADALRQFVPHLLVTHPLTVEDNLSLYRFFGTVFGCESRALTLCSALQAELDASRALTFSPLRVLYLIWRDPWMTVSPQTYIASMLASVGMIAVAPDTGARYPQLDFVQFGAEHFDAVLLSSEPYRFVERHVAELGQDPALGRRPVRLIDGEMASWYGPRAIQGLRYLREFRDGLDRDRPGELS